MADAGRLRVNPIACEGVGVCAHLAAELIHLDSWGYPILPVEPVTGSDRRAAQRAVRGCPRRALFLADR
jgi:ferredoxin